MKEEKYKKLLQDLLDLFVDCVTDTSNNTSPNYEHWISRISHEIKDFDTRPSPDAGGVVDGWISVDERLPVSPHGKLLVTNNIKARTRFGHMSHIWLVNMIHGNKLDRNGYYAFDDNDCIAPSFITHWRYFETIHEQSADVIKLLIYVRDRIMTIVEPMYWADAHDIINRCNKAIAALTSIQGGKV